MKQNRVKYAILNSRGRHAINQITGGEHYVSKKCNGTFACTRECMQSQQYAYFFALRPYFFLQCKEKIFDEEFRDKT